MRRHYFPTRLACVVLCCVMLARAINREVKGGIRKYIFQYKTG